MLVVRVLDRLLDEVLYNTLNPWVLEGCKLCHSWVWELLVFQFHEEIFPPRWRGIHHFQPLIVMTQF